MRLSPIAFCVVAFAMFFASFAEAKKPPKKPTKQKPVPALMSEAKIAESLAKHPYQFERVEPSIERLDPPARFKWRIVVIVLKIAMNPDASPHESWVRICEKNEDPTARIMLAEARDYLAAKHRYGMPECPPPSPRGAKPMSQ